MSKYIQSGHMYVYTVWSYVCLHSLVHAFLHDTMQSLHPGVLCGEVVPGKAAVVELHQVLVLRQCELRTNLHHASQYLLQGGNQGISHIYKQSSHISIFCSHLKGHNCQFYMHIFPIFSKNYF